MQFQSDILGKTIERSKISETTALGAAYLAGMATGFWKDLDEIKEHWEKDATFEPEMSKEMRDDLYQGWEEAVEATKGFKYKTKRSQQNKEDEV